MDCLRMLDYFKIRLIIRKNILIYTFPQKGQAYLYLCIVSNFFINFLSEEPYLTPYFLDIPTFFVRLVIAIYKKRFFLDILINNLLLLKRLKY